MISKKGRARLCGLFSGCFLAVSLSGCGLLQSISGGGDVVLNKTEATMSVGDKLNLNIISDIDTSRISWNSSNDSVAEVSDSGRVKAKKSGTVTISAISRDGKTADCEITIEEVEVEKVRLNKSTASIKAGKTVQLKVKVYPEEADDEDLDWDSSDESVAIVNSDGLVTGKKAGTANITCTAPNGRDASCTVTVKSNQKSTNTNSSNSSSNSGGGSSGTSAGRSSSGSSGRAHVDTGTTNGQIFTWSSDSYIDSNDIAGLSSNDKQMAVNEIYARNGYYFSNTARGNSLYNYYSSYSWYSPYISSMNDVPLNAVERANIAFLQSH